MAIPNAHLSILSSPSGRKDVRHMKFDFCKAMQKPKNQIYVRKEYLFTPALITMKLKRLMQKIFMVF